MSSHHLTYGKARTRSLEERMKVSRAFLLLVCVLGSIGVGRAGKQRNPVGKDLVEGTNTTTSAKNVTSNLPERTGHGHGRWHWMWWKKEDKRDMASSSQQQPLSTEMEVRTEAALPQHHPKKKRRPKSGKQKIANCRHLTSLSTAMNSTTSIHARLSRLWRTLPVEKYVTKYNVGRPSSSPETTNKDMYMAYAMGVVATLSYWDFHKKALPDNRSSFELLTLRQGTPKPLKRRRKRDKALSMALSAMRVALDEASPWLSLLPRTQQKQTSYRDKLRTQLDEKISSRQHRHHIQLEYFFYNWHEPTPLGSYHDTDLILATCNNGKTLIVAFAGTASVPDTVTNLQTFERVQHSGLFHRNQKALKGSIHRGFLNAYSRVERGSVLRLCDESNCTLSSSALHRRYGHCIAETSNMEAPIPKEKDFDQYDVEAERRVRKRSNDSYTTASQESQEESIVRKRGRRGCKVKDKKLMTILRELVVDYLTTPGRSVVLAGHSLGGSLATLHALDIIINFPNVPVNNLEVWTFGGAQVSDDAFLESALAVAPRLQHFLHREQTFLKSRTLARVLGANQQGRSQFHRFVTVSDDCRLDFVSTVAQKTLSPDNERNIHGKTARKLGGILGTSVVHLTEPHYLLTPDQYDFSADADDENDVSDNQYGQPNGPTGGKGKNDHGGNDESKKTQREKDTKTTPSITAATIPSASDKPSSTRSTLAAHSTLNYLRGISRESKDHPLSTDLPEEVRSFIGEISWNSAA